MPDDNQSTNDTGIDQSAEQAANEALENSASQNPDLDLSIPDLSDIEYATPSAYIDPDLPAYDPNATLEPEEPEEEQKEEETLEMTPEQIAEAIKVSHEVMAKVAEKIANSRNILIATSSDPSVDELASAISLSLFLDRLGKHAIAIYSGTTPNALNFLNPEDIFEKSADVLQDFVIAIDKDKADHLRYKLDGDYVKVFITPYKDRISSDDLEFSYGDYNVDLVLALNVNNGIDLDPALREYGTIMRDAVVVNITTGNPGKFGEIEWNNRHSSSVSEMISDLFCNASGDTKLNPEEATALLTGIVASTDRFAHANTFSTTMQIASQLIDFGANPQLVAENITDDVDNQFFAFSDLKPKDSEEKEGDLSFSFEPTEPIEDKKELDDDTALKISHGNEDEEEGTKGSAEFSIKKSDEPEKSEEKPEEKSEEKPEEKPEEPKEAPKEEEPKAEIPAPEPTPEPAEDSSLLNELKATEASLSGVGAETAPVPTTGPVQLDPGAIEQATMAAPSPVAPAPSQDFSIGSSKYSQMLTDALNEPAVSTGTSMESVLPPSVNPAASIAPDIASTPEISSMPEINYGQTSDGQILPPPPTPPVDINSPLPIPASPEPSMPAPAASAAPTATVTPAPDAFTIPGV